MTDPSDEIVVVSLFAGVGGLDHGFEAAGIKTVVQVEWDAQCRRVLAVRFPDAVQFGDVREVPVEQIRAVVGGRRVILIGGFPCQDLSIAGSRSGLAGERSGLYRELLRIADGIDPEWIVLENVPGLLSADIDPEVNDGRGWGAGTAMALLLGDVSGYFPAVPDTGWRSSGMCVGPKRSVAWRVLDARHLGVAQRRRRVFLVACSRDRAAPAAVLLEPEGVRGNPPPGEPPRPRFARRVAPAVVRAGEGGVDGGGAAKPRPEGHRVRDTGVTQSLTAGLASGGADAQHAEAGWMVVDPTPLLEVDGRVGTSQTDVRAGIGIGEPGDPMFTLQAGKQHGVAQPNDKVGALTASGGPQALDDQSTTQLVVAARESGQGWWTEDELAGPLRERDHKDSGTILAYEVDKERGLPNSEGIKVTETEIAPTVVAEIGEVNDRGLRIVSPTVFRKAQRAHDPQDCERWEEDELVDTLDAGGQTARTATGVVERIGYDMQNDALTGDVAPTLQAEAQRSGNRGAALVEPAALAGAAHTHHTTDGLAPAVTGSKGQPGNVAVPVNVHNATKRSGVGDDSGMGVGEDGDPTYTLGTSTPGAVGAGSVRRLTPLECERLQGFDDDWTLVEGASDNSRYREMGNAVCAAVSDWIGWRIDAYLGGWRP
jgi:DNA (cytosine-5)-methyltransferase 1